MLESCDLIVLIAAPLTCSATSFACRVVRLVDRISAFGDLDAGARILDLHDDEAAVTQLGRGAGRQAARLAGVEDADRVTSGCA